MNIELIWAQNYSGGIGKEGTLPWHISEDLKNFKKITANFPIIMGRKTWESLPFKPLPKRRNIVLSSQLIQDVEVSVNKNFYSVEEAAVLILVVSIATGVIDRNILTENGKELVDEYNKSIEDIDL